MSNQSSNQAINQATITDQELEEEIKQYKEIIKHQQFNNYLTNFRYYYIHQF